MFNCLTAVPADSFHPIWLTASKPSILCRYSQALAALQQHVPFSERDSEGVRTAFPWRDAFQGDKGFVSPAIQYERAAVVFNLGALSSQQPLNNDLNTDGGVKLAAKQFQVSALIFRNCTWQ